MSCRQSISCPYNKYKTNCKWFMWNCWLIKPNDTIHSKTNIFQWASQTEIGVYLRFYCYLAIMTWYYHEACTQINVIFSTMHVKALLSRKASSVTVGFIVHLSRLKPDTAEGGIFAVANHDAYEHNPRQSSLCTDILILLMAMDTVLTTQYIHNRLNWVSVGVKHIRWTWHT